MAGSIWDGNTSRCPRQLWTVMSMLLKGFWNRTKSLKETLQELVEVNHSRGISWLPSGKISFLRPSKKTCQTPSSKLCILPKIYRAHSRMKYLLHTWIKNIIPTFVTTVVRNGDKLLQDPWYLIWMMIKHYNAAHTFATIGPTHLAQNRSLTLKMIQFNDGCALQYKSKFISLNINYSVLDFICFPSVTFWVQGM